MSWRRAYLLALLGGLLGASSFPLLRRPAAPTFCRPLLSGAADDIEAVRSRLEKSLSLTVENITAMDSREQETAMAPQRSPGLLTLDYERTLVVLLGEQAEDVARGETILEQLWGLWFSERGQEAGKQLEAATRLMETLDPITWCRAAGAFQNLAQKHPGWAEPINKLATLRFMQGNFNESIALCKQVLEIKPWHFGAIGGITMGYSKLGDAGEAQFWMRNSLPPPGKFMVESGGIIVPRKVWAAAMSALIDQRIAEEKKKQQQQRQGKD
mmetsp:Transcript_10266/g.29304  ORF Transcript_10266/g.29304 Transcript_10266/m.29304 type:complete len:270 (-) Transcript_10266:486-1295(-)|eukprot:CAMPEP_0118967204 /NCGR_PEP_ID=MMETSP1173-20130426/4622_1 /TAXON_ID=1034831 /ORGANISM="Rhizochromulina marina cf, Strain CCMP1243" /LENGTH=269 /DNA_ID=CAMNT_0006916129 /DNA_START=136 /DNA_END=948 /DNA_ORIENTATION=-